MSLRNTFNNEILCRNKTTESQREIINAIKLFGDEGNLSFNESLTLSFDGFVDVNIFALAINRLIKRHDALRTNFDEDGQTFFIRQNLTAEIKLLDFSGASNTEDALNNIEQEVVAKTFNIFNGSLVRVYIVKLKTHHVVVLALHHIICDGWSFAVLLEDLSLIYTGLMSATHMGLEQPNYFIDFLHSINKEKNQKSQQQDYEYWLKLYQKTPAALELPVDKPRQAIRTLHSKNIEYQFDQAFTQQIKDFARQQNCSVVSVLLAAYASLMYKLSGQREIVIALPAAGQAIEGRYRVIGHCVNTLPIPCYVDPEINFNQFLENFKNNFLNLSDHQRISLGGLLKQLKVDRDSSRLPLASLMFNLDQDMEEFAFSQLLAKVHPNGRLFENFELFVNVVDTKSGYLLQWQYNDGLFEQESIRTWAKVYQTLLQQMCEQADLPIDRFVISCDDDFNHQQKSFSLQQQNKNSLIEQLISAPHANSEKIAVISAGQQLSYKQINEQSNQLANYLQLEKSLKAGELIGVCMERSAELIPVLLAIWKCGCAYVPLDPSFPVARLNYMVREAELKIVISQSQFASIINDKPELDVILHNQLQAQINKQSKKFSTTNLTEQALAYVIFTSGSTGKPKGVMVSQYSAANFISSMAKKPGMVEDDKLLSVTTLSFDISVLELFLPLWVGATVVIASADESKDPAELIKLIEHDNINVMQATPSTWQLLLNDGWQGNKNLKVLCGGEAFPQQLAKKLFPVVAEIWNMYGPTEATVWSSCFKIKNPDDSILIGKPIDHTQCYIFDENMQSMPNGFSGELCIGGLGVSAGYLNQSELTQDRFVVNPLSDLADDVIYKTGDKARWNHNGQLEIYGRMDNQVKIRGYRIELGEIESIIQQQQEVADCVVVVKYPQSEKAELVAYIVWHEMALKLSALRKKLLDWIPAYMVPQVVVDLQVLPKLPNGKLDRSALPDVQSENINENTHSNAKTNTDINFTEAKTKTEELLIGIWKEVLGLGNLSTCDNFFDLGGHSLLIAKMIRMLEQKQSVTLQYRDIFNNPNIQSLALTVDAMSKNDVCLESVIKPRTPSQKNVLSLAQQRLWYLDKLSPNTTQFNLPVAYRFSGNLNVKALNQTFTDLMLRHEVLRTSIKEEMGEPFQFVHDVIDYTLEEFDYSNEVPDKKKALLASLLDKLKNRVFDISQFPLFLAVLIKLNENEHVLFFMPHHFIFDGISFDMFFQEMVQHYAKNNDIVYEPLAELPIQYIDYSIWLREFMEGNELDKQLSFWKKLLQGTLPVLDMPLDFSRPKILDNKGDDVYFNIDSNLIERLNQLANKQESSLFMILMTAYVISLYRYTGQTDQVIGSPMADRARPGTENLIGFFINTLVLRFDINPEDSFEKTLSYVKDLCLSGYANQDVPFEKLVEILNPPRDMSRSPLYQTSITYKDVTDRKIDMHDIEITSVEMPAQIAALDLNIWFKKKGDKIRGSVVYNTELFERKTVEQFIQHYLTLLNSIEKTPQQSISQLEILENNERLHLLQLQNSNTEAWQGQQFIHHLISEQSKKSLDSNAICFGDKKISYAQLEKQSNQFANYLLEKNINKNEMIGVCVERSIEMMIALLGVLKAGCAYVPLDPEFPEERLGYMVEDANLNCLITQPIYSDSLPNVKVTLLIDEVVKQLEGCSQTLPDVNLHDDDIAYVIYTSGSTGKPKGVMVHHRAVANFLNSMSKCPGINEGDSLLAVTTLSFDIAVLELYLPLIVGAQLVIASKDEAIDARRLLNLIKKHNISIMQATPATWRLLIGAGWTKENTLKVLCGGEALPTDLAASLINLSSELWNMYGPTETTVWSTCQHVVDADKPISIGTPIANTKLYILDKYLQPVPQGIAGELFIGGDGVSKGYLNRPELSAEKFIKDSFNGVGQLYRTGDKVRYRLDNSLEYMGRLDSQVKVRGYRIELEEIETRMREHEHIIDCALSVKEERAGDVRLVAYVVWKNQALTMTELRQYLLNWVPIYMVPQHVMEMSELPKTPNGKLDRNNLPDLYSALSHSIEFIAPRTEQELWLAGLWKDTIGIQKVGLYDNFFELGGHSLLSMTVIHCVAEKTGIILNPRNLLFDTLEIIAEKISMDVDDINKGDTGKDNAGKDNAGKDDTGKDDAEKKEQKNSTVTTNDLTNKKGLKGLINKIFS